MVYVSTVALYVTSYMCNHTMKPFKSKCVHKRLDNFKVILNQFIYGGKQLVPLRMKYIIEITYHTTMQYL